MVFKVSKKDNLVLLLFGWIVPTTGRPPVQLPSCCLWLYPWISVFFLAAPSTKSILTLSLLGWITSTDWSCSTSRQNLLNPTLNTWVSTSHSTTMIICTIKTCFLSSLVNLISLELTYFCSGILFAAVVKRQVWDYALTVTLLHVIITSLGESGRPDRSHVHADTTASVV